jgi:hypothetical protein
MDRKGDIAWGGSAASEAITWFRKGLDSAILVSVWDESNGEDPVLVTDKIDITNVVLAALMSGRFGA